MENLKSKIAHLREVIKNDRKIIHAKYKKFPNLQRENAKKSIPALKKFIMIAMMFGINLSVVSIKTPIAATNVVIENKEAQALIAAHNINVAVEYQTSKIQKQILTNVDSLQQMIIKAKHNNTKDATIKQILDEVFPQGGLPANAHYCVAGAVKAKMMCNDPTLNSIMPNPKTLPKEYGFASSPNVSCPFMRQYFKNTIGKNYAQKGDKNFEDVIKSLEVGDVITIKSPRNTSTGEHCVTVAGKMRENGTIPVMSLNTEDNYDVSAKQIIGAVKIMSEYRESLTNNFIKAYEQKHQIVGIEKYMAADDTKPQSSTAHNSLNFSIIKDNINS